MHRSHLLLALALATASGSLPTVAPQQKNAIGPGTADPMKNNGSRVYGASVPGSVRRRQQRALSERKGS